MINWDIVFLRTNGRRTIERTPKTNTNYPQSSISKLPPSLSTRSKATICTARGPSGAVPQMSWTDDTVNCPSGRIAYKTRSSKPGPPRSTRAWRMAGTGGTLYLSRFSCLTGRTAPSGNHASQRARDCIAQHGSRNLETQAGYELQKQHALSRTF